MRRFLLACLVAVVFALIFVTGFRAIGWTQVYTQPHGGGGGTVTPSDYQGAKTPVSKGSLGATPTFTLSAGNNQSGTLDQNITAITLAGPTAGQWYKLCFVMAATPYTISWPTITWVDGTPVLPVGVGTTLWVSLYYDGSVYFGWWDGGQGVATPSGSGTLVTLTGPRQYYFCTNTCTATAPVPPAAGQAFEFCVQNDDNINTVITLAMPTGVMLENQARTAYGTSGPSHGLTSGGAVKDSVCIVSRDATHYNLMNAVGTWTAY